MRTNEDPAQINDHDPLGQTASVHSGTSTSITTLAPHTIATVEEATQALILMLPANLVARSGSLLDPVILCVKCSQKDWTSFGVSGVPGPSSDKSCAKDQCGVCRMVDKTLSLCDLKDEQPGWLTRRIVYAAGVRVSGTYSLTPFVAIGARPPIPTLYK
jgi:hypothetical protein